MKTQEKKNYSAPALTVVSFVMERGFAGSNKIEDNTAHPVYTKASAEQDNSTGGFWN